MATTTTKFNVVSRGGVPFTTNSSDQIVAVTYQTKPNTAYDLQIRAVYLRPGANQAGSYWRRALFRTDASGVLTQVSTTQTPAADIEDTAGAFLLVAASGTEIQITIAAEGSPVNWDINNYMIVADLIPQT